MFGYSNKYYLLHTTVCFHILKKAVRISLETLNIIQQWFPGTDGPREARPVRLRHRPSRTRGSARLPEPLPSLPARIALPV